MNSHAGSDLKQKEHRENQHKKQHAIFLRPLRHPVATHRLRETHPKSRLRNFLPHLIRLNHAVRPIRGKTATEMRRLPLGLKARRGHRTRHGQKRSDKRRIGPRGFQSHRRHLAHRRNFQTLATLKRRFHCKFKFGPRRRAVHLSRQRQKSNSAISGFKRAALTTVNLQCPDRTNAMQIRNPKIHLGFVPIDPVRPNSSGSKIWLKMSRQF